MSLNSNPSRSVIAAGICPLSFPSISVVVRYIYYIIGVPVSRLMVWWMAAALVSSSDQSYTSKGIYAGCWAAICPRHHDTSPLYLFEVLQRNACWIRVTEMTAHHPHGGGSQVCVLFADLLKPNFAWSSSRCSFPMNVNVNKPWIIFNVKDVHHLFTHAFQHCKCHRFKFTKSVTRGSTTLHVKVRWCGSLGWAKSLFVSSKSPRGKRQKVC